jgi:hypothetical protein
MCGSDIVTQQLIMTRGVGATGYVSVKKTDKRVTVGVCGYKKCLERGSVKTCKGDT